MQATHVYLIDPLGYAEEHKLYIHKWPPQLLSMCPNVPLAFSPPAALPVHQCAVQLHILMVVSRASSNGGLAQQR